MIAVRIHSDLEAPRCPGSERLAVEVREDTTRGCCRVCGGWYDSDGTVVEEHHAYRATRLGEIALQDRQVVRVAETTHDTTHAPLGGSAPLSGDSRAIVDGGQ